MSFKFAEISKIFFSDWELSVYHVITFSSLGMLNFNQLGLGWPLAGWA